jgi:hypothetical protein
MTSTVVYRTAAVLFVLFALGHTVGFLHFKPPTPEALAVRDAMATVRFTVGRSTFRYGGFYVGFGLYVSAYLIFSAVLAWQLGALTISAPEAVRAIGWAFFAVQLVSVALSLMYFSAAPATFSALIAICLGVAAWLARTPSRPSSVPHSSPMRNVQ